MRRLIPILALLPLLASCGEESQAKMKAAAEDLKTRTAEGVDQAQESISKAIAEFEQSSDETLSKIDDRSRSIATRRWRPARRLRPR